MCGGIEEGFEILCCSIPAGGSTLMADIPAMVLAGMLGPLGRSKDEHLCEMTENKVISKQFYWLFWGNCYRWQGWFCVQRFGVGGAGRDIVVLRFRVDRGRHWARWLWKTLFRGLERVDGQSWSLVSFFVRWKTENYL